MLWCHKCHHNDVPSESQFCPFCGTELIQPYSAKSTRESFHLFYEDKKKLDNEFKAYHDRKKYLEDKLAVTDYGIKRNCTHKNEEGRPILDWDKESYTLTCEICRAEFDDDKTIPIVAEWYEWLHKKYESGK